jgi:hypothetical protein
MMTEQVTVDTTRGRLEWSFERPSGFKVLRRPVPTLMYPWEVLGVGDWDFPQTRVRNPIEAARYADHPRIDLMPPGAAFLWLLIGDVRQDDPWSTPPASSYPYLLPLGAEPPDGDVSTIRRVPPIGEDARGQGHRWPSVSSFWPDIVLLTNPDGSVNDEPLYLSLRAFAGARRSSIAALNAVISSLSYRYAG